MIYLSQLLGIAVVDGEGVEIGKVSDLAVSTGEIFPHITSLAFLGPDKTPFMVSWRKYVRGLDEDKIVLKELARDIRFSYLQPDEILLARDLLNKQIVDTQGMKVVRVNDLKLSQSYTWLRLIGAEVGIRGLLRGLSPRLERAVCAVARAFKRPIGEKIIAWNYMELVDRDLSQVKLSVSHKRLHELHPADIADILEQLDPRQRAIVFEHLDGQNAVDAVVELEDDVQSDLIEDMSEHRAADLLSQMDPDDAADIIGDLPYEKAEALLWLMGIKDQQRIRALLGYKEKTAGGIMTTDVVKAPRAQTVAESIEQIRRLGSEFDSVHYLYIVDDDDHLTGTVSLRQLVLAGENVQLGDIATPSTDLITVSPDADQEEVAETISKYDLLALPVIDENKRLLGIVTIDDAIDVIEEEHDEDLMLAGAGQFDSEHGLRGILPWFLNKMAWVFVWVVAVVAVGAMGYLAEFAPQLAVMPVVLIAAEIAGSFAIGTLIEHEGEGENAPGLGRLLGRNVAIALLIALIVVLLGMGIAGAIGAAGGYGSQWVSRITLSTALPVAASILLTSVVGSLLSHLAMRRHEKGKLVSDVSISLLLMVFAVVVQLGGAALLVGAGAGAVL